VSIVRAGLLAPYAAQAVAGQDFRRFFVFQEGSTQLVHVAALAKRQAKRMAEQLRVELTANSSLPDQARGFLQRLERLAETGVPGIGTPPTTSSWQNGAAFRLPSNNHSLTVWRTCG
jgi:hypothetical protein